MNQQKVSQAVEAFCNMGCTSVTAIIHTLESGHDVEGIEGFTDAEKTTLTNELKAIMAVYEYKEE